MNDLGPLVADHAAAVREGGAAITTDVLLLAILERLGEIVTLLDQLTSADQLIVSDVASVVAALTQLETALTNAQTAANNNPALQPIVDDLAKAHDTLTTALANAAQSTGGTSSGGTPPATGATPPASEPPSTTTPPASEPPAAPAS